MGSKRTSWEPSDDQQQYESKRRKETATLSNSTVANGLVPMPPPLRRSKSRSEAFIVGGDAATLVPTAMEASLAAVLFWMKIDPLESSPRAVVANALRKEGFCATNDIIFDGDGALVVHVLVGEIRIARGRGDTLDRAEDQAYEDFMERCVTSDYLRVEGNVDLFSDKKRPPKLKLFLNGEEARKSGTTAFRYDGLCRERSVGKGEVPRCRICHGEGHNMFFCQNERDQSRDEDSDQIRRRPTFDADVKPDVEQMNANPPSASASLSTPSRPIVEPRRQDEKDFHAPEPRHQDGNLFGAPKLRRYDESFQALEFDRRDGNDFLALEPRRQEGSDSYTTQPRCQDGNDFHVPEPRRQEGSDSYMTQPRRQNKNDFRAPKPRCQEGSDFYMTQPRRQDRNDFHVPEPRRQEGSDSDTTQPLRRDGNNFHATESRSMDAPRPLKTHAPDDHFDVMVINPFRGNEGPRLHGKDDFGTCGAPRISKANLKSYLDKILEDFKKKLTRRSDFLTMVEEGLNESDVSPTFVVEYYAKTVFPAAEFIAKKYGLELPSSGESPNEACVQFVDTDCGPTNERNRFHVYAKDAKRVVVETVADVHLLKETLEGESLILINYHETSLCGECSFDLVTLFVTDHLFHLFSPLRHNAVARYFFEVLRENEKANILCKLPDRFQRFVYRNFNWTSTLYDLATLHSAKKSALLNSKDIWCTDGLAQTVLPGNAYCHRAKCFSAASSMTEKALAHWETQTCMLFTWGKLKRAMIGTSRFPPSTYPGQIQADTPEDLPLVSPRSTSSTGPAATLTMSYNARKKAKKREKKKALKASFDLKVAGLSQGVEKARGSESGSDHSSTGLRDDGFQQVVNGRKVSNPLTPNPTPPSDLVPQAEDFETELLKRLKNLTKKIRQIEELEKKIKEGEIKTPTRDENDKIAKKEGFMEEINLIQEHLDLI